MTKNLRLTLILLLLGASIMTANAQQAPDPRVADLVQAGNLRVGLIPPQYIEDSKTGELRSVWVEFARALAARIGVKLVLLKRPTVLKLVECLNTNECDVIFLPFDVRTPDDGDFSSPFIQLEYTLLVPAGSTIHTIADADHDGVYIAAVRNHHSTIALSRILSQAELVFANTPDLTFDLLRTGRADLMASTRYALLEFSGRLPGSRLLENDYGVNLSRIVVRKGRAERLAYINEFVEQAKASGLVQKAIDRAGARGVAVAQPGDSR